MAIDRENLGTPSWVAPVIWIPLILIWLGFIAVSISNAQDERRTVRALDEMGAPPNVLATAQLRVRRSVETTVGLTVVGAIGGFAWCLRSIKPRWRTGFASTASGVGAAEDETSDHQATRATLEAEVDTLHREVEALARAHAAAVPQPRGFGSGLAIGCVAAIVVMVLGFVSLLALTPWGNVR
jgi:hypothetical protein